MEDTDDIPPSLLRRHPELIEIHQALGAYVRGEQVTARCRECGRMLKVTEIAATNSLWVTCPEGHVSYHLRRGQP